MSFFILKNKKVVINTLSSEELITLTSTGALTEEI